MYASPNIEDKKNLVFGVNLPPLISNPVLISPRDFLLILALNAISSTLTCQSPSSGPHPWLLVS